MRHVSVRNEQFACEFTFRGVDYCGTGRYGYIHKRDRRNGRVRAVLVSEAVGPNGEVTWSDSDGNFSVCPADKHWPASTAEVHDIFEDAR